MNEQTTAVSLMRMARALLDRDGMTVAACHLEQAIHMASDQSCVDVGALNHGPVNGYIGEVPTSRQTDATGG